MKLKLYIRSDCHLCQLADEVLRHAGAVAEVVAIDDDHVLELRYGMRIPVLADPTTGKELDWPFDAWAVRQFRK